MVLELPGRQAFDVREKKQNRQSTKAKAIRSKAGKARTCVGDSSDVRAFRE